MPAEAKAEPSLSVSELQLRVNELADQLRSKSEECEEGLQREAAMAEILRAISDPTADLASVFDVLVEKAAKLCTASYGYVWLYDGTRARAIAAFVEQPFRDWLRDREPFVPAEASALGQAILHKRLVHVVDAVEHQGYQAFPIFREVIDKGGVRTLLHVPLCRGGDVLGVITVFRQERRPFSDRQIALLESFAAQAAIALEDARLLGDLRERTGELARSVDELTATSNVLKIISRSSIELITVLDTLVETASRLCGADHATMFRWRDGLFHMVASHGLTDEAKHTYVTHPIAPDRGTVVGRVALERRPVHVHDVLKDPHYTYWEAQTLIGFRTMLGIPLLREEQLIGVFVINRIRAEPFTGKDIELVTTFADQAVIAIENARLFEELHDRQAELRVTIDNMGGGVAMFDADLRLTAWNRNIQQILDLSDEDLAARPTYDEYLRMLADRGEYGTENVEATLSGFLEDPGKELRLERVRPDGTVVEVRRNPVPGGGFVVIYIDITEHKQSQEKIRAARDAAEAALERQTATADILRVIAGSPTDVRPVLDAVAKAAVRFCGAADALVHLRDGDEMIVAAHEGPLTYKAGDRRPLERSATGARAIVDAQICHHPDIETLDPVEFATTRSFAALHGYRAIVAAPLMREDVAIGAVTLRKVEPGPYMPHQIALLETFAAQAVIAIENVRLFSELRESLEQQTATGEVLQVINSSPGNLTPVFETILEKARALCGAAYGSLLLYDGVKFRAMAVHGQPEPLVTLLREGYAPEPNHPSKGLLAGDDYVHIRDIADVDHAIARASVEAGIRTILYVALRKHSRLLGQVVVSRKEVRPFADKEISLLRNFAAQAVIAMENARLLGELRERTDQVAELNRGLEARVAEQVEELGRVGRLKRFLAPQLAELIVSQGDEKILESHRREIVVVFCDLRGYTAFTEAAEPEEVLDFLRAYHGALGPLVSQFEGTLDQFSGDGIMVFFNDPVPIPDPAERAVKMAVAMREAASILIAAWRERGRELGFGVGVAQGYATLGQIGFSERSGYTAIGTVCNVAARLCGEAKDGQILLGQRVNVALKGSVATELVGALTLKGLTQPVIAYNVPVAAGQPVLRVIDSDSR